MSSVSKSKIIVLHQTKYSDSSAVIHAVDSSGGRRSFLARGLGKGRAGSAKARELHPLSLLDVVSYESPGSSMAYLREWSPVATLESIRSDIVKSSIALFISELIYRTLRDDAYDTELFEWLCKAILNLESMESICANYHIWFLSEYCSRMGFRPSGTVEPQGILQPSEITLLETILNSTVEEVMRIPLNASSRVSYARNMVKYLSYHLGTAINLKSFEILHELFA